MPKRVWSTTALGKKKEASERANRARELNCAMQALLDTTPTVNQVCTLFEEWLRKEYQLGRQAVFRNLDRAR